MITEEERCAEMSTKAKMFGFRCEVKRRKDKDDWWVFSVKGDWPNWRKMSFLNGSAHWTDGFGGSALLFVIAPHIEIAAQLVDEMCTQRNV